MKIRTRVSIVTVAMLVLAIALTATVSIVSIREEADREAATMREEKMAEVRQSLKDFVDLAYESAHADYENSADEKHLEAHYGERLKNMAGVVYDSIRANHDNAQSPAYLEAHYGHRLRNILEIAQSILDEKLELVAQKKLTLAEAQAQARASINRIRYNNSGYIWINDMQEPFPKMVQHPLIPALNGKILDDPKFNCALGTDRNLFRTAVEVCKKKGEGFIEYTWPKPGPDGTLIPNVPKLSFVKLYKPWNWVLGVGVYIDDAIEDAKQLSIEEVKSMRYDNGQGYFWINDDTLPFPKMIMHPISPKMNGQVMDGPEFNRVGPEKKSIFTETLNLCKGDAGEGFLFYKWAKATTDGSVGPEELKVSFVKAYKPWNWIIGTGIYLDRAVSDAKNQAIEELKKMRYHNGEGYYWITDSQLPYPTMIMHPISPALDGQRLDDPNYNCVAETKENLFRAMAKVALKDGGGFVSYRWPKPNGNGEMTPEPKLAYVRLLKPWGWVIGTGVYVDHIHKEIAQKEQAIAAHVSDLISHILMVAGGLIVLAIAGSILFAGSLSKPILHMIGAMKAIDIQTMSTAQIKLEGAAEIRELGGIYNNMLLSIHDSIEKLQTTTIAKEKMEGELDAAREIQMSIIPKLFPAFPERPEFDVYASIDTAKAVGGDLYDFFFVGDDKLCFTVGDVSGKGVPASLFMAVTHTLLRAKTSEDLHAGEIMTKINSSLCIDNDSSMFVTMFFCILDLKTGRLEYCNAGHNPPYLILEQNNIQPFDTIHGMPLGIMELEPYSCDSVDLKPGDSIFLYSDGVTEAFDDEGEMFEEERLEAALAECKMQSPKGTVDLIARRVKKFVGTAPQSDDITLLSLTYRGG